MALLKGNIVGTYIGSGGIPKKPVAFLYLRDERLEGYAAVPYSNVVKKVVDDWEWRYDKIQKNGKFGGHGGPDKAVCLFPSETYDYLNEIGVRVLKTTANPNFQIRKGLPLRIGEMGENITVKDLSFKKIRVGDVFQLGEGGQIQITQPRQSCVTVYDIVGAAAGKLIYDNKVLHGDPTSTKWGMSGFYARVKRYGRVQKNNVIVRIEEGNALRVPRTVDKPF
jgi:MOSC domain-containing protein YiiM